MATDDPVEPLFTHDEQGPLLKVGEAAKLIAAPYENEAAVAAQFRQFAAKRLIQNRGKFGTGRTAHNLFAHCDVATGKLLRSVSNFGVADLEVMEDVSLACYACRDGAPYAPGYTHPMELALSGFTQPKTEYWFFKLDVWITPEGRRECWSALYPEYSEAPDTNTERIPEGSMIVGSIIIPIWEFFPRLVGPSEETKRTAN